MPLMNAYEPRGKPPPLTGPLRTRAEARIIYGEIVGELNACDTQDVLEIYLITVGEQLIQFENELPFFWDGDGEDFAGLDQEIKKAWRRVTADW